MRAVNAAAIVRSEPSPRRANETIRADTVAELAVELGDAVSLPGSINAIPMPATIHEAGPDTNSASFCAETLRASPV
jgi:hypothetical protein